MYCSIIAHRYQWRLMYQMISGIRCLGLLQQLKEGKVEHLQTGLIYDW